MSLSGYSVPETLTDDAGNALKSITVAVTGPSSYSGTATTDATTGVLRLGPLPAGDYTVTYRGRSVTVPVVADPADVLADAATDATARVSAEATARSSADLARLLPRGAWVTATAYAVNDTVIANGVGWRCVLAHTSGGSFSADPTKWERFGVGQVVSTPPNSPATDDLYYDKAADLWKRWNGSAWVSAGSATYPAVGAADAQGRIRVARVRRLSGLPNLPVAVGGGMGLNAGASGSASGFTGRNVFKIAVACTDIQLVFPVGFYLGASAAGELAVNAAVPVKAAIELADGTIYPVYFKGSRTGTADPNGYITSDPIALDLAAGDVVYARVFVNVTTGNEYINTPTGYGPGVTYSGTIGYVTGDACDTPGSGTFNSDVAVGYWAPIICGTPLAAPTAQVAVVGDSISVGTGSATNGNAWWKYGLNNAFPAIQYARSGIYAQSVAASHRRGFPLIQGLSHAFVLLGSNDLQNGRTATQLQADLTAVFTNLVARGFKVYAGTVLPVTTSSDSWATLGNQTSFAGETYRVTVNTWLRTVPSPLSGIFDTADTVESARNSGKWKVTGAANGWTGDGIHPNDTGHAAMGAAIDTSVLVV